MGRVALALAPEQVVEQVAQTVCALLVKGKVAGLFLGVPDMGQPAQRLPEFFFVLVEDAHQLHFGVEVGIGHGYDEIFQQGDDPAVVADQAARTVFPQVDAGGHMVHDAVLLDDLLGQFGHIVVLHLDAGTVHRLLDGHAEGLVAHADAELQKVLIFGAALPQRELQVGQTLGAGLRGGVFPRQDLALLFGRLLNDRLLGFYICAVLLTAFLFVFLIFFEVALVVALAHNDTAHGRNEAGRAGGDQRGRRRAHGQRSAHHGTAAQQ